MPSVMRWAVELDGWRAQLESQDGRSVLAINDSKVEIGMPSHRFVLLVHSLCHVMMDHHADEHSSCHVRDEPTP